MDEYERQAVDFLAQTNTKLSVSFLYTAPYFNDEDEVRDVYAFTLQNKKGVYSATFGDSVRNTQRRAMVTGFAKKIREVREYNPNAYDILSCLGAYYPVTFKDFCAEFGYDDQPLESYPKTMEIFTKCIEEARGMRQLFDADQLEQLASIS